MRCPNSVMPLAPGCVECNTSVTDSLRLLGKASLLSNKTQPLCTLRLLHLAWICLLSFLHLCSSPDWMQSRTSRSTVSRLVMAAISFVLKRSSGVLVAVPLFLMLCLLLLVCGVGLGMLVIEKVFLGEGDPVVCFVCSLVGLSICWIEFLSVFRVGCCVLGEIIGKCACAIVLERVVGLF